MTLTKEEYLAMVAKLVDEQYGNDPIEFQEPKEPLKVIMRGKERTLPSLNLVIDATKYKKEEIKDAVLRAANLRIDNFLIKIIKHNYSDSEDGMPMTYNLNIYEESPHIYLNRPSKKITKLTPSKDSRMDTRPWLSYFVGDQAHCVTLDDLLNIIRWLQAIGKMGAFL